MVALSKRLFCLVGLPCLCLTGKLPSPLFVYPVFKGSLHINMDLPPEALYPSHPPTLIAFDTNTSQLLSINEQFLTELRWRLKLSSSLLNSFSTYTDIGLQNSLSWTKNPRRKLSICFIIIRSISRAYITWTFFFCSFTNSLFLVRTLFTLISQIGIYLLHVRISYKIGCRFQR